MPAHLTLETLKADVAAGTIDTVLTCVIDMQGRLMGKRFHAAHFVDHVAEGETHGCDYLLATDLEMYTVPGYTFSSWQKGYGDYVHKPDLSTLRRVPWLPATAMVICDILDHHTHEPVPHAPRTVLKRQIERARAAGFDPMMATELEFFMFEAAYDTLRDGRYTDLRTRNRYNIDYAIFGTTKEEDVMRAIRNGLHDAGVPVECTKGEAEVGQEEINVRYADALATADHHAIVKNACKEIAHAHGRSITFMAKYATDKAGSSAHVHQSLMGADGPAFHDPAGEHGMSATMRSYLAGLLAHSTEITAFLAPYVNSYKRFTEGLFAPTKSVWSTDNRTAGFRVCGAGTKGVRVECRIGGADLNPYLALAAQLAAGLAGIEKGMELEPESRGDVYQAGNVTEVPRTLRLAADALDGSAMLRAAMGEAVVDHYVRAARWEIEVLDRTVTDWDLMRGFELA
ncbi:glutamine synthetase [Acuticoccus sediminis]|uniref:Glutamine synthetase n=1 Tax=Acuticoccus sediminis TaxID=2184697 RepID=A0A8B2NYV7_9HYPH|nr:glutamine synthetase family protein [Acuticoccus sediminis]RAI03910.1 glutamine synthetase [Acuticoccus sediminis]